jgi:predicted DNA-binding protein (UPF0251 family)
MVNNFIKDGAEQAMEVLLSKTTGMHLAEYTISMPVLFGVLKRIVRKTQDMNKSVYSKEVEDYLTGRGKPAEIEKTAKAALNLLYFKGCTFDEAAIKLNVSLDVLKTKVRMAMEQINATVAA